MLPLHRLVQLGTKKHWLEEEEKGTIAVDQKLLRDPQVMFPVMTLVLEEQTEQGTERLAHH